MGSDDTDPNLVDDKDVEDKSSTGELKAEDKPQVVQPTLSQYGAMLAEAGDDNLKRFPWRKDGVSLRKAVWQNGDPALKNCHPPVVPLSEKANRTKRTELQSEQDHEETDKGCSADCGRSCWFFAARIKDLNPFMASAIAFVGRKFGPGIALFFELWRFLLGINLMLFILWAVAIMLPWLLNPPTFVDSQPSNAKYWARTDLDIMTVFGTGRAAMQSFMFYTGYVPTFELGVQGMADYAIGPMYIFVTVMSVVITFLFIVAKIIKSALSTAQDSQIEKKMKTSRNIDRVVAEELFTSYDFNMTALDLHKIQQAKIIMSLDTILDDAYANKGVGIFLKHIYPLPMKNGEIDVDCEDPRDANIATQAFEMETMYNHRRLLNSTGKSHEMAEGTAGQAYCTLCVADGYQRWYELENIEQSLADAEAAQVAAQEAVDKAYDAKPTDEELGAAGSPEGSPQPVLSRGFCGFGVVKDDKVVELEAELEAADAELARLKAVQGTRLDLDIYHHDNMPNGVLLRRSVFRTACIRDKHTKQIIQVQPFDEWERVSDAEAADLLSFIEKQGGPNRVESSMSTMVNHAAEGSDSEGADTSRAEYRGMNVQELQVHILSQKDAHGAISGVPSTYEKIGGTAKKPGVPGMKVQGTVFETLPLSPDADKFQEAQMKLRRDYVTRCVYTTYHDHASGTDNEMDEGTCNSSCATRYLSFFTTVLLIILTGVTYTSVTSYSHDIIEYTGSPSAPNLILTVVKTIVPVIVVQLVKLEKHSSTETALNETVWRVYGVKMIALFFFAYHLKTNVTTAELTKEVDLWGNVEGECDTTGLQSSAAVTNNCYYMCAAARVGYTYLNLVWVNTIIGMLVNFATYAGPYYAFGTKTVYDGNVVALAYIELFYTQGLVWLGTPWAPIIPLVFIGLSSIDCLFLTWIMGKYCKASEKTFDGSESRDLVEQLLVATFIITSLPTMWFLQGDPEPGAACMTRDNTTCTEYYPNGPISMDHSSRYQSLTDWVSSEVLGKMFAGSDKLVTYLTEPMVAYFGLLVLTAACVVQQCVLAKVRAEAAETYDELNDTAESMHLLAKKNQELVLTSGSKKASV